MSLREPVAWRSVQRNGRERVLVVRSPVHAERQAAGLEKRLAHAEQKLAALTPARGRGKRQITEEANLVAAIDHVLKEQRVEGLLHLEWEQQIERHTHYVGRGRGSATRPQRVVRTIRYHITRIARQGGPIAALKERFGWKAFVTNATPERLSLADAVLCYRNEYRIERIFNRLKSRVHIAPLFVKRRRPNRGPHVPADVGRAGVNGDGVCPAALSAQRSRQAPRSTPGKPDQDDRHANG